MSPYALATLRRGPYCDPFPCRRLPRARVGIVRTSPTGWTAEPVHVTTTDADGNYSLTVEQAGFARAKAGLECDGASRLRLRSMSGPYDLLLPPGVAHFSRGEVGRGMTLLGAGTTGGILVWVEESDRRDAERALDTAQQVLSLNGTAEMISRTDPHYARIKHIYLTRFPEAEQLFRLGDFNLWRITPRGGRFVAGFPRAFNLVPEALVKVSKL